jgi:predicted enzyme related to lactoylglutathione lyase
VVNLYVRDVERMASFYSENFGFVETFRTPASGEPVHIELRLEHFVLGLASIEAARAMHHLPLNPGSARSEIALWTDDVDVSYSSLVGKGLVSISEPHTFIGTVRAAWLLDPEGNHIQVVSKAPLNTAGGAQAEA